MLRIALIEDELGHLLQVIADIVSFDPSGDRVNFLPILVKTETATAVRIQAAQVEERLKFSLAEGQAFHFPHVDQSLAPIDLEKPSERSRLLQYLDAQCTDMILSDCSMGPELAGVYLLDDALAQWKHRNWECWLMTQYTDLRQMFLTKEVPGNFDPYNRNLDKAMMLKNGTGECAPRLRQIIEDAIQRKNERKQSQSRQNLGPIVGRSPAILAVYEQIETFARTPAAVLITGPTGTGKELVAQTLHELSGRHGRLIAENCARLDAGQVEGVLFGWIKGAFTSSVADRAGLAEQAHGGTLFLDEIGDLPPDVQAKLLRVLETRRVVRMGQEDKDGRTIDFRLISATSRDLLKSGFRQDLFYRLNGALIEMPQLNQRKEDIPLLVEAFIREANLKSAGSIHVEGISPKALGVLKEWHWPGNVRELRQLIERAANRTRHGSIDMLCPEIEVLRQKIADTRQSESAKSNGGEPLENQSARQLWEAIVAGRYQMTLTEWSNRIGEPKTIELTELAGRYYQRTHPSEDIVMKFFNMSYNAYKNWIARRKSNA